MEKTLNIKGFGNLENGFNLCVLNEFNDYYFIFIRISREESRGGNYPYYFLEININKKIVADKIKVEYTLSNEDLTRTIEKTEIWYNLNNNIPFKEWLLNIINRYHKTKQHE